MSKMAKSCGAILLIACFTGCGGAAELGEECDASGATQDECEDGGICGDDGTGVLRCLRICTDQDQCAADEECNGVGDSNIKGCRKP